MKNLENLKGAKKLNKKEQLVINGGRVIIRKPELCNSDPVYPLVVCYYPERCAPDGNGCYLPF